MAGSVHRENSSISIMLFFFFFFFPHYYSSSSYNKDVKIHVDILSLNTSVSCLAFCFC